MSRKYQEAARVLDSVFKGKGGIKTLTYNKKIANKPTTYALVCQTLKFKPTIQQLLQRCGLKDAQLCHDVPMLYVMLYDFLFGKGIQGGGAVKRAIKKHEQELRKHLADMLAAIDSKDSNDLLPDHLRNKSTFPRFARVNLIKQRDVDVVLQRFKNDGHPDVVVDPLIPYLLVFPPNVDLHDHPLVLGGDIVLQDKPSCLPVHALVEGIASHDEAWCPAAASPSVGDPRLLADRAVPSFDVIDACAAPGNKTSQMAALLFDHEKVRVNNVFAFDKSKRRLGILSGRMGDAGATNVQPMLQDFLECDPHDPKFANVRAIVLDPSCSGSGMVGRVDYLVESENANLDEKKQEERLERLSEFQLQCLKHAFSFPQVEYVAYSTCSIHVEEDELVVEQALDGEESFRLIKALPSWHRRGMRTDKVTKLDDEQLDNLVRVDFKQDNMNGFFVSVFKRKSATDNKRKRPLDQESAAERKKRKMRERRKMRRAKKSKAIK